VEHTHVAARDGDAGVGVVGARFQTAFVGENLDDLRRRRGLVRCDGSGEEEETSLARLALRAPGAAIRRKIPAVNPAGLDRFGKL